MSEPKAMTTEAKQSALDVEELMVPVKECKCSLRIALVGDGCSVCNPEFWAELLAEDAEDAAPPISQ